MQKLGAEPRRVTVIPLNIEVEPDKSTIISQFVDLNSKDTLENPRIKVDKKV